MMFILWLLFLMLSLPQFWGMIWGLRNWWIVYAPRLFTHFSRRFEAFHQLFEAFRVPKSLGPDLRDPLEHLPLGHPAARGARRWLRPKEKGPALRKSMENARLESGIKMV